MTKFEIYPAIDLISGQVVRLKQGDRARKTTYSPDPASIAGEWCALGASWLHIVNLDGAFGDSDHKNQAAVQAIAVSVRHRARIQFGGGIRSLEAISAAIDLGVERVVLGTVAVEDPDLVDHAMTRYGPRKIAVGLDAVQGEVRTRGWTESGGLSIASLGARLLDQGVETVIYTDIDRDGMGTGVERAGARLLAGMGFSVIASGGAGSLADVELVHGEGFAGLIIGKALYDGRIDLAAALRVGSEEDK